MAASDGRRDSGTRLPASARARLARFTPDASHTSFLSVPSAAGLRVVGLDAVGDAMGCATGQISHEYVGLCGTARSGQRGTVRLGGSPGWGNSISYLRQLRDLYARALARLRDEGEALRADGIVGIDLTLQRHEALHEVVAVGTAVRARSRSRPARVFTTDLPGADVAKLMFDGWVPVRLHVAVQLGVRHDDLLTMNQSSSARRNRDNTEVTGYAELLEHTNHGARSVLRSAVAAAGADGCLLSDLDTVSWHTHCRQQLNGSDHVARSVAVGTSVARFGRGGRAAPTLRVLPLGTRSS